MTQPERTFTFLACEMISHGPDQVASADPGGSNQRQIIRMLRLLIINEYIKNIGQLITAIVSDSVRRDRC